MARKLNDNRGETLVEVLASILIAALSVALLFTAVMASVNMDKTAKAADKALSDSLNAAEGQGTGDVYTVPSGANVTISGNSATATPPVIFYGGEGALSYALP